VNTQHRGWLEQVGSLTGIKLYRNMHNLLFWRTK